MLWSSGHKAYEILVPQPGVEPASPTLEEEVPITGAPGKSQHLLTITIEFVP